ncbi:MAG: terminase large subunit [SAR202 cluster bacterium]|nr:terminase large subunit [SAR202 cluster bacterium]
MTTATTRRRPPPTPTLDPTTAYARAVIDGRVLTGRLVRLACERHLNDLAHAHQRGLRFDPDLAQRAIALMELMPQRKGEWQGRPLRLEPWQRFIAGSAFGWTRDDGTRRYRKVYVELGRKNGKTTLAAAVGNYLAWMDGEPGAEIYAAATKRETAKICWSEAKWQLDYSPPGSRAGTKLGDQLGVNLLAANMHQLATASKFEPLGADENSGDGINPHAYILDELHAWKDRLYWGKLQTAMGARRQPITWIITTAGDESESIYGDEHEYALKVVEGVIDDDSLFAYVACLDEGDAWDDESAWVKANPNLGVSLKLDYLRQQCAEARGKPNTLSMFKRMHCGLRTASATPWIALDLWDAQAPRRELDELEGQPCYAGLDLSSKIDLTALVLLFPDGPDAADVHCFFYVPEDNIAERAQRDRVPYDAWVEQGYITATPGASVDYEYIERDLAELRTRFDLRSVAKDPWNGNDLHRRLEAGGFTEEEGCPVVDIPQNYGRLSDPTKEVERLLMRKAFRHGGNPVLRWNAANAVAVGDANENIKLDKRKSKERIDGMAAAVNATAESLAHRDTDAGMLIYAPWMDDE